MDKQKLHDLLKATVKKPGERADNDALVTALEAELANAMLRIGTHSIRAADRLAPILLSRARNASPEDAIRWLDKVLSAKEVTLLTVMPLWGLDISRAVQLTDSVRLVPANELPFEPLDRIGGGLDIGAPVYRRTPPSTALVARDAQGPLVVNPDDPAPQLHSADNLEEVRLCLNLLAPCTIVAAPQQVHFEDPEFAADLRSGGFSFRLSDTLPLDLCSFGDFDPNKAPRLVQAYLALAGETRERIHLALDRFDRALSRFRPGDAAVELAVSLDALVGDGEGELTWKVSLRSALLAGGTREERLERRAIVHATYSLRSAMVHKGHPPPNIKMKTLSKISPDKLLPKAVVTTSQIITAAIYRGELPDWFAEELGP